MTLEGQKMTLEGHKYLVMVLRKEVEIKKDQKVLTKGASNQTVASKMELKYNIK